MNGRSRLFAIIILLLPPAMHAQECRLTRSVIGAGATRCADAQGGIGGTAGQHVIGLSASPDQRLGQGFWYRSGAMSTRAGRPDAAASTVLLGPNYPNPFGPGAPGAPVSTRIDITLPSSAHTTLALYDVMGNLRRKLIDQRMPAGVHTVHIRAGQLPPGVYLYRLEAEGVLLARRMLLVR